MQGFFLLKTNLNSGLNELSKTIFDFSLSRSKLYERCFTFRDFGVKCKRLKFNNT
jgi:hypothetical protein